MLDKEKVGTRIRQVRNEQQKTLREVESASGFSSTHISEIERGRTCPTIGALIQIAEALGKDPSYFIEERELDELAVTSPGRRANVNPEIFDVEATGCVLESLTPGILGGRLEAMEMVLEPGAKGRTTRVAPGLDLAIICLEGSFEMEIEQKRIVFGREESAHANLHEGFVFRNPAKVPARVLLILDPATTHI